MLPGLASELPDFRVNGVMPAYAAAARALSNVLKLPNSMRNIRLVTGPTPLELSRSSLFFDSSGFLLMVSSMSDSNAAISASMKRMVRCIDALTLSWRLAVSSRFFARSCLLFA